MNIFSFNIFSENQIGRDESLLELYLVAETHGVFLYADELMCMVYVISVLSVMSVIR